MTHIISCRCPFCGKVNNVELTDDQYERYCDYTSGIGLIQDMLYDVSKVDRELLKTGICEKCWKDAIGIANE